MKILDWMIAPYCDECGARCTRMRTGWFDTSNGRPEWIYVCPTRLDGHWGMNDGRVKRYE
jgi:hypothetical protein